MMHLIVLSPPLSLTPFVSFAMLRVTALRLFINCHGKDYIESRRGKPRLKGIRVWCDNPEHLGCSKVRNIKLDTAIFGPIAGFSYLGAWPSQNLDMAHGAHAKYKPTRAEFELYREGHT